jgi:hypothetical protein
MTPAPEHARAADPMALYDVLDCASLAIQYAEDGRTGAAREAYVKASLAAGDAFPLDSEESRALGVILAAVGGMAAGSEAAA